MQQGCLFETSLNQKVALTSDCCIFITVEDLDFNSPPSNVTFPPTTSSTTQTMCFNVTITDDDIFECREDFLVLINGSIPMVTVGLPSTATVEIISNDGKDFTVNCISVIYVYRFGIQNRYIYNIRAALCMYYLRKGMYYFIGHNIATVLYYSQL